MLNHTALAAGAPRAAQYDLIRINDLRWRLGQAIEEFMRAKAAGDTERMAAAKAEGFKAWAALKELGL